MTDLSLEGAELDASREAFEADFSSRYPFQLQRTEGNGGDYSSPFASVAWQSWQAAEKQGMERAAKICDKEAADHMQGASRGGSSRSDYAAEACRDCASEIRDAIGGMVEGGSER